MNHRNAWIGFPVTLIAIIAILSYLHAIVKIQAEEQHFGQCTSKDILNRIKTLRTLSLLPASATQSALFVTTRGTVRKFWYVTCSNEAGEFAGYVVWDADTGELCLLCRNSIPLSYSVPDVTRTQAISQAWRLLRQPGIGIPAEQWSLDSSTGLIHDSWHVNMKSSVTRASLTINRHTGQITNMHFWNPIRDWQPANAPRP